MNETIIDMSRLLAEVSALLEATTKPNQTAAVAKLERICALASTLAFTIRASRR